MAETESHPSRPEDLAPRLAAAVHGEGFPAGDRARLKRMGVSGTTPLAFHRFVLRYVPEPWQGERLELKWRALIGALARQHQNPHTPDIPLGRALAQCGYSEARLESLLAAEGRVLATLTLRAATRLAAQRARCNWTDTARLLFAFDDDARERTNRRIARDFYRTASETETAAIAPAAE